MQELNNFGRFFLGVLTGIGMTLAISQIASWSGANTTTSIGLGMGSTILIVVVVGALFVDPHPRQPVNPAPPPQL